MSEWWLYLIETEGGRLYTGITTDVERRYQQHESGRGGARFFRTDPPVRIAYRERCEDRSQASRREAAIKKWSHQRKRSLFEAGVTEAEVNDAPGASSLINES